MKTQCSNKDALRKTALYESGQAPCDTEAPAACTAAEATTATRAAALSSLAPSVLQKRLLIETIQLIAANKQCGPQRTLWFLLSCVDWCHGSNTVFWIERPDQPCFDFVRTSAMPKVKATTCPPGFQDFSLLKLLRSCPIWPQCWPTAPWHSLDTRQRSGRCSSLSLRKSRPAGGGKRLDLSDLDWSAKFQTKTHLNLYPCHES